MGGAGSPNATPPTQDAIVGPPGGAAADAIRCWRDAAAPALRRPRDALGTVTPGGLVVEPLYGRSRVDEPQPWRDGDGWSVAQRVDHPDPSRANGDALADLEGGADALVLVVQDSPFARGFGLPVGGGAIEAALHGVELDFIALRLDGGVPDSLDALATLAVDRRLHSAGLMIDGGCDPIGRAACLGIPAELAALATALAASRRGGFRGCALLADGRPYAEAGAGEADELAAVLATAVAYLRRLSGDGVALYDARDQIAVLLTADADFCAGIAKMRAMRQLWARVEEACGLDAKPLRLHAETAWRCMTRRDPHTNALRAGLGAAAAGLGGATSVTVLPMTLAAGLPDAAARRLARNTNRILIDEAQLARVDDAAGGSGTLEAITRQLCDGAWEAFQTIEAAGGLPAAAGQLRERITATAIRRASAVATRDAGIVGTSLYPRLDAGIAGPAPRHPAKGPLMGQAEIPTGRALPRRRDAEPFERLRDAGEAAGQPTVSMVVLGSPGDAGSRVAGAASLLAAAGLAATTPTATPSAGTPAEIAASFRASGARIACLCGSDAGYRDGAAASIAALRGAGARCVMMAADDEHWRTTGVDHLIHDRCSALEVLAAALEVASIP